MSMQSHCNGRAAYDPGLACSVTASICVNAVTLQRAECSRTASTSVNAVTLQRPGCLRSGPSLQCHCIDICECSNTAMGRLQCYCIFGLRGPTAPGQPYL